MTKAMTAVIRAEGLGKRYRRGVVEPRGMLRDSLVRQREMFGDRIDAEDHATIDRLVHDDDRESLLWRPDVFLLNARTVHSARRLGDG